MINIPIEHAAAFLVALAFALTTTIMLARSKRPRPALPVVLVRTRAPLPPVETENAIKGWHPSDPTRQAVEDAFDVFLADTVAASCSPDATSEQRAFAAGALDATIRFKTYLFGLGNKAEVRRR